MGVDLAHRSIGRVKGVARTGYVLGIDPGQTGGMALLEVVEGARRPRLENSSRVPLMMSGRVDPWMLHALLACERRTGIVILEKVGPAPKQGVASTFSFGHDAGLVYGVIVANRLGLMLAYPQVWKEAFRLPGGKAGKAKSVALCEELVGKVLPEGQAEAVLIAWYGAQRCFKYDVPMEPRTC